VAVVMVAMVALAVVVHLLTSIVQDNMLEVAELLVKETLAVMVVLLQAQDMAQGLVEVLLRLAVMLLLLLVAMEETAQPHQ
jgi:hypothetical protein